MTLSLCGWLPKSWRFTFCGLPPRGSEGAHSHTGGEVSSVKNGLAAHYGANLEPSGSYIPALTKGAGLFIETRALKKARWFPRIKKVKGTVLSLVHEGQTNYFRWLMETLPRMRFIQEEQVPYDWIYACQKQLFHRESLSLLGVDPARILPAEQDAFLQAEVLKVPRFIEEHEPWIVPWLRKQFLPLAQGRKRKIFSERIYITRGQTESRHIANEAAVLKLLKPLGFVPVALEELSLLDQCLLFNNAEFIIGPHGAGLTNLVFCPASARVIELMAKEYSYSFYPQISAQINLEHHILFCSPLHQLRVESSDLEVDLDQLARLLSKMGFSIAAP